MIDTTDVFSLKISSEEGKVVVHIEVDKERWKSTFEPLLMGIVSQVRQNAVIRVVSEGEK